MKYRALCLVYWNMHGRTINQGEEIELSSDELKECGVHHFEQMPFPTVQTLIEDQAMVSGAEEEGKEEDKPRRGRSPMNR